MIANQTETDPLKYMQGAPPREGLLTVDSPKLSDKTDFLEMQHHGAGGTSAAGGTGGDLDASGSQETQAATTGFDYEAHLKNNFGDEYSDQYARLNPEEQTKYRELADIQWKKTGSLEGLDISSIFGGQYEPDMPEGDYKRGADYIDPAKSTVQGQLTGLLEDPSNPLMQQAKTRSLQESQAGGRQNTTMAQTAGMDSMYRAAMGIAVPDAQTYATMDQLDADYDFKKDFFGWQNRFDKMALEKNLAADERQMMTSSFSSMFGTVITDVTRIMTDQHMPADSKRAMINEIWQNYQDSVETFSDLNNYDYEW